MVRSEPLDEQALIAVASPLGRSVRITDPERHSTQAHRPARWAVTCPGLRAKAS